METDWFHCTSGVRQGDVLSSIFINDLVLEIQDLGLGIPVHDYVNFYSYLCC